MPLQGYAHSWSYHTHVGRKTNTQEKLCSPQEIFAVLPLQTSDPTRAENVAADTVLPSLDTPLILPPVRRHHSHGNTNAQNIHTSKRAYIAFSSINLRRGSTSSPMRVLNTRSASTASESTTCIILRRTGFIVVSQS